MGELYKNARLILTGEDEPQIGNLAIEAEEITGVGDVEGGKDCATIECDKQLLAPGIVDLGVYAIDKPAFRAGGITRAALLPDQNPILDMPAMVNHSAKSGKPDLWVHPIAAATRGLEGRQMAEIGLMKDAGAMAVATGRQWVADSGLMLKLLQYCAALDLPVIVHSEDSGLTKKAVATAGETATRLGLSSAIAAAEAISIARDIALVRETGAHVHFRQVTTASGLELVRQAKQEKLPISCGITPAHFLLSDIAISDFRTFARLSPPLRNEEDRLACVAAIADGTIDMISSGHDPRGAEDKRLPFAEAAPGMAGANTLLALSLTLVRDGTISIGRLFELLSTKPAKLLGVKAGQLEPGFEADFILVNADAPWQIDTRKMAAAAGNTPFDGLPVQGRVTAIYKGGRAY